MTTLFAFLSSPYLTYPLVALGGLVAGLWLDNLLAKRERRLATATLEEVRGKIFSHETVDLDGKHFILCQFHSVKLRYAGGPAKLTNNSFDVSPVIQAVGPELESYTVLLAEFGKLSQGVMTPDGPYAITTKSN